MQQLLKEYRERKEQPSGSGGERDGPAANGIGHKWRGEPDENHKIGLGTCGVSAGGEKTYEAVKHEIEQKNIQAIVKETGCNGMCYREPLMEVIDEARNSSSTAR